jgi:transcriptional regulator with XRE-family HTH domain
MITKEAKYRDIGWQLKAIRKDLEMTLDAVSKETVMSRSYLSDFERGFRLPTAKYLKYLHDRHNVNLNYVFGSDGRKFRPTRDEAAPEFGRFREEVDDLLRFMAEIPHTLYSVLGFFSEYKLVNKKLIEQHRAEKQDQDIKERKVATLKH